MENVDVVGYLKRKMNTIAKTLHIWCYVKENDQLYLKSKYYYCTN